MHTPPAQSPTDYDNEVLLQGKELLARGTALYKSLSDGRSSGLFLTLARFVARASRTLGPNTLGIKLDCTSLRLLHRTEIRSVVRMSVVPTLVADASETHLRVLSYAFWANVDARATTDHTNGLLEAASSRYFAEPTVVRQSRNKHYATIAMADTLDRLSTRQSDEFRHTFIVAALLAGGAAT